MDYLQLNESNLQNSFLFNGTDGTDGYKDIVGTVKIDLNEPYCVNPLDSDFIVIDLGYTIDGQKADWNFVINNKGLNIQTVATRNDISGVVMADNDILIVTDDSYFRTVVMLKWRAELLGQVLEYTIKSYNTSLSSFMMDVIAVKLNKYNPEAVEERFTNAETKITRNEVDIAGLKDEDTAINQKIDNNKTEVDNKINDIDTAINQLDEKTAGLSRDADTETSTISDNLTINKNVVIDGTLTVKDNTILKDTTVDTITANNDIEIKGNVKGTLKDANGYKYIKVRQGTINDANGWTDISFMLYDNGRATVNATYTNTQLLDVDSLKSISLLINNYPSVIQNINTIQVLNKDTNFNFIASAIKKDNNSFNLILRNISGATANIQGLSFDFIFDCQINEADANIVWQ